MSRRKVKIPFSTSERHKWSPDEISRLKNLLADGVSYGFVASALKVNFIEVQTKAAELGVAKWQREA